MEVIRQIAHASVAHRYREGQQIGSNVRIEAVAECTAPEGVAQIAAALARVKALVDHQCLFTDLERFRAEPSTAETMADFLGAELFTQPLGHGKWRSLTLWETSSTGCTRFPEGALELHLKHFNVTLNLRGPLDALTRLIARRESAASAVHAAFTAFEEKSFANKTAWGRELFSVLKQSLPQLESIAVDLGRHEYLLIPESV